MSSTTQPSGPYGRYTTLVPPPAGYQGAPYYYDASERKKQDAGIAALAVGAVVGGVALPFLILGLANGDGSPTEHVVSEADGLLYTAVYNRRLLRKMIKETERQMRDVSSVHVRPVLGPGFGGFSGTF